MYFKRISSKNRALTEDMATPEGSACVRVPAGTTSRDRLRHFKGKNGA